VALLVAAVALGRAEPAFAASEAEQACQRLRYDAAAKYTNCELKVLRSAFSDFDVYSARLGKCHVQYAAAWPKIQAKSKGTDTSCDQPRFSVGGGTVIDRLTGLQWEQKTDDGGLHDKDDLYTWSEFFGADPRDAIGTAFRSFLPALNTGACFARQCDWRLPTRAELETILLESFPCSTSPCIDQRIFGPTAESVYLSSTPEATEPYAVWGVAFFNGFVNDFFKDSTYAVRAVRGGW